MKRFVLACITISAFAGFGSAHASCAGAGQFYSGHVTIGDVKIDAYGLGLVLGTTGPAQACSDPSAGLAKPYVRMTLTKGSQTCNLTEADGLTFGYDPFVFGAGFHGKGGACGADVSFDALSGGVPSPDPSDVGTDGTIAWVSVGRTAVVHGSYWMNGADPVDVPAATSGRETMGIGVLAAA